MYTPELDRPQNPEAYAAAQEAITDLPFDGDLTLFRFKQGRSWVYFNRGSNSEPDIAVKVEPDSDGSLHLKREASALQIQKLHERGAPIQNYLLLPQLIGRYAVSVTEYLPGSFEGRVDFRTFGAALAKFHATPISPEDDIPGFNPLDRTRETYEKLIQLREENNLPRLEDIVFDEALVDNLAAMLQTSEEAAFELEDLSQQKGQAPFLLHNDITPFNAMRDKKGNVVLIDLDRYMAGPWAYDLARVVDHWPRFDRDPRLTRSFLEGYATTADWELNDRQIKLGVEAAKARYAATLMTRVVQMALRGQPQNEYLLGESINRISGEYRWHSEEAYIRAQGQSSVS